MSVEQLNRHRVLFNDSKAFLKPGVLGSPCSRRHRLCVAMTLGAEQDNNRFTPPVNAPVNAPVNTPVNTPVNALVNTPHKYSWNQVLRIATCPSGSIGHQPNNGPPSPEIFGLKQLKSWPLIAKKRPKIWPLRL